MAGHGRQTVQRRPELVSDRLNALAEVGRHPAQSSNKNGIVTKIVRRHPQPCIASPADSIFDATLLSGRDTPQFGHSEALSLTSSPHSQHSVRDTTYQFT